MLYDNYVRKLKICPFCKILDSEKLEENKSFILILSRAPYTKDHLLLIPKRHVLKMENIKNKERLDFEKLLFYGIKKLHKKYRNISIIYKEGSRKEAGKSMSHMHYHLIPNVRIDKIKNSNRRKIFSKEEYLEKTKEFKKGFSII